MMMYGLERYLGIERELLDARFYVSLDQCDVYSEFFTREIILLGVEIEAAFKELCHRIDGSKPGNMGDYKRIILEHLPNMPSICVYDKSNESVECPFAGWSDGRLSWWEVYTSVKHNLVDRKATLGFAMSMTKAYELLIFCIAAMAGDIRLDFVERPKLFEVGFPEHNLRLTSSLEFERVYKREEVLARLGYQ